MPINASDSLTALIGAGADSFSNLFKVTCSVTDKLGSQVASSFSARVNNFPIPEVAAKTAQFPYMIGSFEKIVPSSSINRVTSFNLRIDKEYEFYNKLLEYAPVDASGNYSGGKIIDEIRVEAYTPEGSRLATTKKWCFKDCEIQSIGSFTYNYDSSNPVSTVIKFTWGYITTA